jgi:hypothetical protein
LPYDVTNHVNDPELYGFIGGVSYQDFTTPQYVGYGNFDDSCSNENPAPGYILTSPVSSAGAYLPCDMDYKTIVNVHYLLKHPHLNWVPTNANDMMTVSGVLKLNIGFSFMYSRFLYKGNYHIGKLHAGVGNENFFAFTADGLVGPLKSSFEILVCQPPATTESTSK